MENQQQANGGSAGGRRPWAAYNVVEKGGKRYWNRVGSAFHNRDGSMNIYLDALPRDGKIQIREDDREREPKKRSRRKGRCLSPCWRRSCAPRRSRPRLRRTAVNRRPGRRRNHGRRTP